MSAHYELLRGHVLSGSVSGVRRGLAVMLHKGMAAWMEACSSCGKTLFKPTASPSGMSAVPALSGTQSDEFIDLFSTMALNRLKEVYE